MATITQSEKHTTWFPRTCRTKCCMEKMAGRTPRGAEMKLEEVKEKIAELEAKCPKLPGRDGLELMRLRGALMRHHSRNFEKMLYGLIDAYKSAEDAESLRSYEVLIKDAEEVEGI